MITGIFHQGSGLGNQLFRYITTRTLAKDKGYDWTMLYRPDGSGKQEGFKGTFFLNQPTVTIDIQASYVWQEKKVVENGVDIRGYDPEINFVKDGTIIDGEFQDERYWSHRIHDIDQWLAVEPLPVPDDTCLIGFRGGEYATVSDLFLTQEYWDTAIKESGCTKFEVHTDDYNLAKKVFPYFPVIADMELNWRAMRYAKHAIIANSSFFILPRLLRHYKPESSRFNPTSPFTIAPRYWARRTTKTWALPQNYYSLFTYV